MADSGSESRSSSSQGEQRTHRDGAIYLDLVNSLFAVTDGTKVSSDEVQIPRNNSSPENAAERFVALRLSEVFISCLVGQQ